MADEAPRYEIGTIEQMAAIPVEARGRFLAEFPEILSSVAQAAELHDIINKVAGEEVATLTAPVWVDDDKGEKTYTATDKASGEQVFSATMKMRRPS